MNAALAENLLVRIQFHLCALNQCNYTKQSWKIEIL